MYQNTLKSNMPVYVLAFSNLNNQLVTSYFVKCKYVLSYI